MKTANFGKSEATTNPNISATELRMGGKYSIRRDGMTAWATCETIREARTLLRQANNTQSGHKIIDNRTVTEVA